MVIRGKLYQLLRGNTSTVRPGDDYVILESFSSCEDVK